VTAVLAVALGVSLAAPVGAQAREQWLVRDGVPSFALAIPQGFMRQSAEGSAFAAYGHPGRQSVMLVYDAGDSIAQENPTLSAEQSATLRASDTILFDDRPQQFSVAGFIVPGFVGRARQEQTTVVRWIAVLPTQDRAVAVQMVAPEQHAVEMRAAFEQTLARAHIRTRWRTVAQRRIETVSAVGFAVFASSALLYASLRFTRWRGAKSSALSSRETGTRSALLAVVSLGLMAHSSWWITRSTWDMRILGIFFALYGLKQILNAVKMRQLSQTQLSE
jgi:hypothetical protein